MTSQPFERSILDNLSIISAINQIENLAFVVALSSLLSFIAVSIKLTSFRSLESLFFVSLVSEAGTVWKNACYSRLR